MNKEILENKIANLLNVSEEDQKQLFYILKLKLAEFLKVGEAVRIPKIGVFQLKHKLSHGSENKDSEKNKNITLVFSPEPTENTNNSLFINLEVDEQFKDDIEFDNNIFQLGIGKSLLTDSDTANEISDDANYDILTNKVQHLLENSEKLANFDLWDDYLQTKETKSILDDDNFEERLDSIVDDNEIDNIANHLVEKDFVELNENEMFDDILKDEDFIHDDRIKNVEEELEIDSSRNEISYIEDTDDEVEENKTLKDFDIDKILDLDDKTESKITLDEKNINDSKIDFSELDELDLELNDQDSDDGLKEENKTDAMKEPVNINITEPISEINLENDEGIEITEDESIKKEEQVFKSLEDGIKYTHTSKKHSPLIYVILAAVIIIGALAVYYLLLRERPIPFEQTGTTAQVVEEQNASKENNLVEENESVGEEQISKPNENEAGQTNEPVNNKLEETAQKIKETSNQNFVEEVNKPETQNKPITSETKDDKEIEKNIYFNGSEYSVQVSSWKQKAVAEKEVKRFSEKGFHAFIVTAYIAKFQGTWHRVRIGPFKSIEEAKQAQKKI